jgi:hypothetical protein
MNIPEHITGTWMASLGDADLLTAESELHSTFVEAESRTKRARGADYELMRGPADLLDAWGRWSRVSTEARSRGLHPRRQARS